MKSVGPDVDGPGRPPSREKDQRFKHFVTMKGEKSQRRAELCDWIGVAVPSSPSVQSKCLSIDNGRECVCVCV